MADADGAVRERRRDAQRLLLIEGVQSATALGLLGIVAWHGLDAPAAPGTTAATAALVWGQLVLALLVAAVLLALAFRARMGRELVLIEIARLEAEHGDAMGARHPYRERASLGRR